uniref:Uncharacterized protein n=1 Tax=Haptolina brevifila TaxID=156173 RepID=A0A7S2CL62_9EUKA|mmetsp:Transcript_26254/g.52648  ORF Transcript_26254/g.52648 Transcript_26254/m.52648 type:complete len:224 (+) Transcript_26254:91-762(+)
MASLNSKIVVVGDGMVGKTAMLHSYANNRFPQGYEPTIFDNYTVCVALGDRQLSLCIWDTAGQEDYDRLRVLSYLNTDCVLVCYSLVRPESWENVVCKWLPEVRQHCKDAKIVLVGLKCDLCDTLKAKEKLFLEGKLMVNEEAVNAIACRLGVPSVRCSALTQHGLKNVFDTAIRTIHAPAEKVIKRGMVNRLLAGVFRLPASRQHKVAKPTTEGRKLVAVGR